ncbi:hypothetical protein Tco_0216291 [Tanacetum coccineum]
MMLKRIAKVDIGPCDVGLYGKVMVLFDGAEVEARFPRLAMSSNNTSSAVTYTSISSDSNGLSWGIPLVNADELLEMDSYKDVEDQPYADDALPIAESPGHIADSESMEEDFIDYPDEPEDDDEDPKEDLEEDHTDDPADGEDGDDYDDDDTDDEDEEPTKEEEEHIASVDPSAVPVVDLVPPTGDTEAFKTDESAPTPRSPQTRDPFFSDMSP